ncbi:unnamed protein product, partial [Coregonus sp. 'balchen']
MALHLSLLLLLFSRLSGTQAGEYGVSTVSKVSVKTGNFITIPCRYNLRYIEYVKYWCQGDYWNSCSALVRTDQPKISGTVSISDDVTRRIFSVTMTDLQPEDSGYYWCAVETTGRDQHTYLHLSVTTGTPGLYVDQQEVTGVEGGSVTVRCYYSNSGDMKWCRMGGDCVSLYSGILHDTSVTLKRTSVANNSVLTVTMSGLKMENTEWCWCEVGQLGMPVHITVSQQTKSQRTTKMTSTTQAPTNQQPSASPTAEHVQTDNTSQGAEGNKEDVHQRVSAVQILLNSNLNVFCVDVFTVRRVSVQAGGSITIPCHYDQYYKNHVKYWCKGYDWSRCSSLVRSDHPKSSGNASISDDINQRVFTVTMTDLEPEDSKTYRCVVEINGGPDIGIQRFYLSVTPGTPELYVDQQEVTAVEGGSVTVRCYYSNSGDIKWCRMGGDCVSGYSGTLHGTSVTLKRTSDANNRTVLTVTMSGLKMENTDWYWCEVGELEMPVHITVSHQTATQNITAI